MKVSALRRGALDVPAGQRKLFSLCIKEKQAGGGGGGSTHSCSTSTIQSFIQLHRSDYFFFSLPAFWLFYLSVLKFQMFVFVQDFFPFFMFCLCFYSCSYLKENVTVLSK